MATYIGRQAFSELTGYHFWWGEFLGKFELGSTHKRTKFARIGSYTVGLCSNVTHLLLVIGEIQASVSSHRCFFLMAWDLYYRISV